MALGDKQLGIRDCPVDIPRNDCELGDQVGHHHDTTSAYASYVRLQVASPLSYIMNTGIGMEPASAWHTLGLPSRRAGAHIPESCKEMSGLYGGSFTGIVKLSCVTAFVNDSPARSKLIMLWLIPLSSLIDVPF